MHEIKLRVQRMSQKQLDDNLLRLELPRKVAQTLLIIITRRTDHQLTTEFFNDLPPESYDPGLIHLGRGFSIQAEQLAQFFMWRTLHANKNATAVIIGSGPTFYLALQKLPSTKVEVPNTEIGSMRSANSVCKCSEQLFRNIVKDSRHWKSSYVDGSRYDASSGPYYFKDT